MKTIVVASDFSKVSDDATKYALEVARFLKAKVVLFHLHMMSVHVANARLTPKALQESLDLNRLITEKAAEKWAEDYGVEVIPEWRMGDFYTEIKAVIETHTADVLIMGMAKKSLEQDLMGNTTTAVISRLDFPVLAIPQGSSFKGIKTILFAYDIEKELPSKILANVRDFAKIFDASLEIFHVSNRLEAIEKSEKMPDKVLKTFGDELNGIHYFYKNVSSNAVLQAIEDEVNVIQADLLIMVPYKYGFWGSLVHKSKTRAMASGNNIPLLSIPI